LKKYKHIVLFSGDSELEKALYSKIHGLNRQTDTKSVLIKTFDATNETIYEVWYDTSSVPMKCYFDAEMVDSTHQFFINSEGLKVENGITQSSEFARSGKYSCKLTKEASYGFTAYLSEVQKNEHYRISVWRYYNNSSAGLVIASNQENLYYNLVSQPVFNENQWQKLEFDFIVPENLHLKDIKLYCYNNDLNNPAYFDDLIIEKLSD